MDTRTDCYWVWAFLVIFLGRDVHGQVECLPFADHAPGVTHMIALNVLSWTDIPLGRSSLEAAHVRLIQTAEGGVTIASGLLYSLKFRRHSFILGGDMFRYPYTTREQARPGSTYHGYFEAQGHYRAGEVRLGYRRLFGMRKLNPFVGIDFAYRRASKVGTYEGYKDVPPYDYAGVTQMTSDQFIGSLLCGLAYKPIGRWLIRFETGCSLGVGWTRSEPDGRKVQEVLGVFNPVRTLAVGYEL